jgi:anti-sigma B factor antagonist
MKEFRIDRQNRGNVEIIRLSGSLDTYSFPRLEALLNNLHDQGYHRLILDCKDLDYIGSAGLGSLIGFAKRARENGGDLKLLHVPERIHKIIDLLGFTKVLQVHVDEQEAFYSFPSA